MTPTGNADPVTVKRENADSKNHDEMQCDNVLIVFTVRNTVQFYPQKIQNSTRHEVSSSMTTLRDGRDGYIRIDPHNDPH